MRAALAGLRPAPGREEAAKSVKRVFQALRIEVNDEFGQLESLLAQLPGMLRPGGRAAVLTFHSGEDRRVKLAFREGLRAGVYAWVSDVIRPGFEEQRANPRSCSAKLRVCVRAGGAAGAQPQRQGGGGGGADE